jgi:hypothetical protein
MSASRYQWIDDPDTGEPVCLFGSRCGCSACRRVFAGEYAFDLHRVGRFEPDERRCLDRAEMSSVGLFRKTTGVWGRFARKRDGGSPEPNGPELHGGSERP